MIRHIPALVLLNSDCKCLAFQGRLLISKRPEPGFVFRFHFVSVVCAMAHLNLKPVSGVWRIAMFYEPELCYALRDASQWIKGLRHRPREAGNYRYWVEFFKSCITKSSFNQSFESAGLNATSVDFMRRSFVSLTDFSIVLILPDSHTVQVCNKPLCLRFTDLRHKEVVNILWWGNSPCYLYLLWMDCVELN